MSKAVHNLSIYKHKFNLNNQLKLTEDNIRQNCKSWNGKKIYEFVKSKKNNNTDQ